jgi:hypothetical protein
MPMAEIGAVPTMPGQDAFGAVQEIVRILEADPKTDWSKRCRHLDTALDCACRDIRLERHRVHVDEMLAQRLDVRLS